MWIMWKRNRFVFTTNEVVDQFISGVITDLIFGEKVEVLCVYASNSNIKRRVLWRRMAEISAGWRGPGMVLGDFNTIRLQTWGIWRSLTWLFERRTSLNMRSRETGLLGLVRYMGRV